VTINLANRAFDSPLRPTLGYPAYSSARSPKLREVEPPHSFLQEPSASVVHHADYLNARDDHALCGVVLSDSTASTRPDPVDRLCPDCETRVVEYHLRWWRERAEEATAELEKLRIDYRRLQEQAGIEPLAPGPTQADATPIQRDADDAEAELTTFLGQARRELTELCRQFDGAVPYFRLKKAMGAFSDSLDDQERLALAEEIGADGSLIRWATVQIETLGWQVSNSPVQENTEMMWEEWLQETPQTPAKTKRRFGRSK
jgi:hypothetical protein